MIKYLQRCYALSHKGAVDNIKGILSCVLQNISFMLPVGLLYLLVGEIMNGTLTTKRIPFYMTGCIAARCSLWSAPGWSMTTPISSPMWNPVCAV